MTKAKTIKNKLEEREINKIDREIAKSRKQWKAFIKKANENMQISGLVIGNNGKVA